MSTPEELALKYTSPRARELNHLDRYIKGTQYEGRVGWLDESSEQPLFDRKPCVIYPIGSSAIGSHIAFVLGEGRWPTITSATSEDDREIDEEWGLSVDESDVLDRFVNVVLVKYARLQEVASEMLADAMSMRSVGVVVSVQDGSLRADVLRSPWCTPTLDSAGRVLQIEIRYPYIDTYYNHSHHQYERRCLLYRRVIDGVSDTVYRPAQALETGREPEWQVDASKSHKHGLGFCPAIWYPFLKGCTTIDVVDGQAIHEGQLQEMDALNVALSQRHRASIVASDPQMYETGVDDDQPLPAPMGRTSVGITQSARGDVAVEGVDVQGREVGPVSGRAPLVPGRLARKRGIGIVLRYQDPNTKVGYLTIAGDSLKAIDENARDLRAKLAESLNVVFIDPSELKMHSTLSGKALSFLFAHQLAFDDRIRTDFANKGLLPLVSMLLRVVLVVGRTDPGSLYIPGVKKVLPVLESFERDRVSSDADSVGDKVWMPPRLTPVWGPYFAPNEADQLSVVNLTIQAFQAGLCTREMAIQKLANSGVLDVGSAAQVVDAILAEKQKDQQAEQSALHTAMQSIGGAAADRETSGIVAAAHQESLSGAPDAPGKSAAGTSGPAVGSATEPLSESGAGADRTQRGTSQAGIAESVYQQLREDFPDDAIAWVRGAQWEGPVDVPLDQIDFSNRDRWQASKDKTRVNHFAKKIRAGDELKPAILINEPNNEKLIIADGHHRALASEKAGVGTVRAYVATVGTVSGPWDEMHAEQDDGSVASQQS